MAQDETFDVFLCHNSADKEIVRQLAKELRRRNLRVWLDEWELVPGRSWQEPVERTIETVKAAVVSFGAEGIGPWQSRELRALLEELVQRRLPVIPVLLPDAPRQPRLPGFLKDITWVDLRSGLTSDGIERLVWGIRGGKKPSLRGGKKSQVLRVLHECCERQSVSIVDLRLNDEPSASAIREADLLIVQADQSAGDRVSRKFGVQAATLVAVTVAHSLPQSQRGQALTVSACECVLEMNEVRLAIRWPPHGQDRLYSLALAATDHHDERVYRFLYKYARRPR